MKNLESLTQLYVIEIRLRPLNKIGKKLQFELKSLEGRASNSHIAI